VHYAENKKSYYGGNAVILHLVIQLSTYTSMNVKS